ncbi:hypothetical protein [Streptomyces sp. YIM S03343]
MTATLTATEPDADGPTRYLVEPSAFLDGDYVTRSRLAHATLTRKIDNGTLTEGTEITAETTADLLGADVRTAQQALNLLIMERKAARVRRGIPTAHGGMRVEEVTVIGPGPSQGTPGTLEVLSGPSPEEMQARMRMDVLADALEDALGQIQELRERLDHLGGKHTHD